MQNNRCTTCNKSFSSEDKLYQHKLKTFHKCEKCSRQFLSRDDVKRHMRTHKMYRCTKDNCSRRFFLASSLRQHMSTSTHLKKRKRPRQKIRQKRSNSSGSTMPLFIKDLEQFGTMERLLYDMVELESETVTNCKKVVDDVVNFLHGLNVAKVFKEECLLVDHMGVRYCKNVPKDLAIFVQGLNVAEVFKGGSLAKGTGIRLKNDIDLVVFLNDTTMADLESDMEERLVCLKKLLIIFFNDKLTFESVTQHSVQFKLRSSGNDDPHSIDLLPAVDLIAKYGSKEKVYEEMKKNTKSRPYYSACLAKLQVEIVKDHLKDAQVELRNLIKLVKHWKVREKLELKSYSVELIVLKLWQKLGQPKSLDLRKTFKEVMREMSNLGSLKIFWPDEYLISHYGGLPGDNVIIMDPANPYGNTAKMLKKATVYGIAKKAEETLQHL